MRGRRGIGILVATAAIAAAFAAPILIKGLVEAPLPSPADAVRGIERDFDILAELRVTRLMSYDGCDFLLYQRGAFVTDPESDGCRLFDVMNPVQRHPFDAQARADFDMLVRETAVNGRRLVHVWLEFEPDGAVAAESGFGFGEEWSKTYVYAPGRARSVPAKDDSSCASPVNDDWYRSWGC